VFHRFDVHAAFTCIANGNICIALGGTFNISKINGIRLAPANGDQTTEKKRLYKVFDHKHVVEFVQNQQKSYLNQLFRSVPNLIIPLFQQSFVWILNDSNDYTLNKISLKGHLFCHRCLRFSQILKTIRQRIVIT